MVRLVGARSRVRSRGGALDTRSKVCDCVPNKAKRPQVSGAFRSGREVMPTSETLAAKETHPNQRQLRYGLYPASAHLG